MTKELGKMDKRCIKWMNRVIKIHKGLANGEPPEQNSVEAIEDAKYIIECIKNRESMKWIPVISRPITDEERKEFEDYDWVDDVTHIFTCPLPEDGDEILVSMNNGRWVKQTVFCNDYYYGVGDEDGYDWFYDVDAWMPLPKGYEVTE